MITLENLEKYLLNTIDGFQMLKTTKREPQEEEESTPSQLIHRKSSEKFSQDQDHQREEKMPSANSTNITRNGLKNFSMMMMKITAFLMSPLWMIVLSVLLERLKMLKVLRILLLKLKLEQVMLFQRKKNE